MTLRDELIQVAAVAVAIVQDLDYETTAPRVPHKDEVGYLEAHPLMWTLDEVAKERRAQEEKWGPRHLTPEEWLAILAEEVGEAAREVPDSDGLAGLLRYRLLQVERMARRFLKERFG